MKSELHPPASHWYSMTYVEEGQVEYFDVPHVQWVDGGTRLVHF